MEQNDEKLAAARQELECYKRQYAVDYSTADLTPTICALCGVREPSSCCATPIAPIVDQADKLMNGVGKTQKVLLFCPDAVGENQRQHSPELLARVKALAGFEMKSATVMPSVTPACYGSIFSGTAPSIHGIQKYEKPVLTVETLFDVFAAAGKKVAILAVNGCSIDTIFRGRKISYYSFTTDQRVFEETKRIVANEDYDLIVTYQTGYDHAAHQTGIFSPESMAEMTLAVERFEEYSSLVDLYWKNYNRALVFVPDHGQHPIDETHGGHGMNIPEDMIVNHYYRIRGKQ